jgi:hypothetical protein
MILARFFLVVIAAVLSGCATYPSNQIANTSGFVDKLDDALNNFSCGSKESNSACYQEYESHPQLRLLRARVVAAAAANYASKRIKEYSEDTAGDASKVLVKLESTVALLDQGMRMQRSKSQINQETYAYVKGQLYESFADLVYSATGPTRKQIFGMAISTPLERFKFAGQLVGDVVQDEIDFGSARDAMRGMRKFINEEKYSDEAVKAAWGGADVSDVGSGSVGINYFLKQACGSLVKLLGVGVDVSARCSFVEDI